MIEIPLTRGMTALVDDQDYEMLARHKWYAMKNPHRFYAVRNIRRPSGSWTLLMMHNAIMGEPPAPGLTVDHREIEATLDNRRSNLRWATKAEQKRHSGRYSNNKSGYKGVAWCGRYRTWHVHITLGSKLIYLGTFWSAEDGAHAYDKAALLHFGEFAHLNFPAGITILAEPDSGLTSQIGTPKK
jgi:hypothetical protein